MSEVALGDVVSCIEALEGVEALLSISESDVFLDVQSVEVTYESYIENALSYVFATNGRLLRNKNPVALSISLEHLSRVDIERLGCGDVHMIEGLCLARMVDSSQELNTVVEILVFI